MTHGLMSRVAEKIQSYAKMAALAFNNIFTPNIQARTEEEEEEQGPHRPVMQQVQETLQKMMKYCINNHNTRCLQRVQFLAMALAFYAFLLEDRSFSRAFSEMAGQELSDDDFRNIFTTSHVGTGSLRRSLGDKKLYSTQLNLGEQSLANVAASLRKAMQRCSFDNMSGMSRTPVVLLLVLHVDAMKHLKDIAKVLLQSLAYDILLLQRKDLDY